MRFLESTNFFVRTIMFDFVNKDKGVKLKFRLVPVLHIGSAEFYEAVFANLNECDEVFYEGAMLKEIKFLSRHYKLIAKKLDLVTQRESLNLKALNVKLIHTDYTLESGKAQWGNLRIMERIKAKYFLPIRLFIEGRGLTRERYAKMFMTSTEEMVLAYGPREDEEGTMRNLIMHEREKIIFGRISTKMRMESDKDKVIGIIYGVGHMKTIARFLIDKFNYIPENGKFMKVFNVN